MAQFIALGIGRRIINLDAIAYIDYWFDGENESTTTIYWNGAPRTQLILIGKDSEELATYLINSHISRKKREGVKKGWFARMIDRRETET